MLEKASVRAVERLSRPMQHLAHRVAAEHVNVIHGFFWVMVGLAVIEATSPSSLHGAPPAILFVALARGAVEPKFSSRDRDFMNRAGGIRTRGLFVPNEALYQAEPQPAIEESR
jgi:hypothetical protein